MIMNYKRLVILFIVFSLFPVIKSFAQEQKEYSLFEVSVSTGLILGVNPYTMESPSSLPLVYDLTLKFFPTSWLSIGLSAGNDTNIYWGDGLTVLLTPSVQFHWLRKRSFTAYSGISYTIPANEHWKGMFSSDWAQGFEYTPIGITYGRSLFGLAEIGYGPRYYPIRIGIGYRF